MKEDKLMDYVVMGLFSALGSYVFYKFIDKKNKGGMI